MIPNEPQMSEDDYRDLMNSAPEPEAMTDDNIEDMYHEHIKAQRHDEVHGKKNKKSHGEWPHENKNPF
jgi:hypothetical protein